MSTTTVIVIIAVIVVFGTLGAILVARSRRRGAHASQLMGLPDLDTMSGEPLDETPSTATREMPTTARTGQTRAANGQPGR